MYYLIWLIIILFVVVSIFWFWGMIKRVPLLIQYKKDIQKIEEDGRKAIDAKIEEVKEKCLHDTSISDEDLEQVVLGQIKIAGDQIVEEIKEKLKLLELEFKEKVK